LAGSIKHVRNDFIHTKLPLGTESAPPFSCQIRAIFKPWRNAMLYKHSEGLAQKMPRAHRVPICLRIAQALLAVNSFYAGVEQPRLLTSSRDYA
jgi:hypothetical protein